ncbi:30S ribosomal protein S8 [Nanobdella aerobiophila]|uniref:30S ribosomal protein S8 n=1 Tax=Nanobdella aerobiophila TaxID=2586965 RepID=A0A915SFP3_9ARCH|nr:30S ribosomal protein S8 [Nanobdella aerobiophila]BBL45915.1 30S ribosomal protein S8 [Nanobdella aerobiophila]
MVDIINDFFSHATNSINVGKKEVRFGYYNKLLLSILEKLKSNGYIENYNIDGKSIIVKFSDRFNFGKAIKPRFPISYKDIDKYEKRFLPARGMGLLFLTTNKGIKTNVECKKEKNGGALLAVIY